MTPYDIIKGHLELIDKAIRKVSKKTPVESESWYLAVNGKFKCSDCGGKFAFEDMPSAVPFEPLCSFCAQ